MVGGGDVNSTPLLIRYEALGKEVSWISVKMKTFLILIEALYSHFFEH